MLKCWYTYLGDNMSPPPRNMRKCVTPKQFKLIGPRSVGFVVNPIKAVPTPHSPPQSSTPAWCMTVGPSALGIKILLLFASRLLLLSDLGCRRFRVRTRGIFFLLLAFQHHMFIAALFMIAKTWKKPQCPLTREWIKKMCIYKVEYYSATKRTN